MVWYVCYLFVAIHQASYGYCKKQGGTGFEDVDDIGASTFESWDWSVQFPVTALCAVAVGFQKGGLNNVSF